MEVRNLKEKSGLNLRVERKPEKRDREIHHSWALCFVQQDTEDSSLILRLTLFVSLLTEFGLLLWRLLDTAGF